MSSQSLVHALVFVAVVLVFSNLLTGWPFSHVRPPHWANALVANTDWRDTKTPSERVARALQARFPRGTAVADLRHALRNDGFEKGPYYARCFFYDDSKRNYCAETPGYNQKLFYSWDGLLRCQKWLEVKWTEYRGRIESVTGEYGNACLGQHFD